MTCFNLTEHGGLLRLGLKVSVASAFLEHTLVDPCHPKASREVTWRCSSKLSQQLQAELPTGSWHWLPALGWVVLDISGQLGIQLIAEPASTTLEQKNCPTQLSQPPSLLKTAQGCCARVLKYVKRLHFLEPIKLQENCKDRAFLYIPWT